ncbi:MAG: hypothetical protein JOZ24_10385 [Candidatus Eremiobacteraeota bacterium]|nr:hypothetical protein [Candidatus Eremiobacteraeota bacterium]
MWRFYLIASAIVIVLGSVVFAHRLARREWDVRARPRGTPAAGAARRDAAATPARTFRGEGGWALSAVPDCVEQESAKEGPPQLLAAATPPDRERLAPGTVVRRGRCAIVVGEHDVWIERGEDRLRIPPEARLYGTADGGLTLVWRQPGRIEVRRYAAVSRDAP